MKSVLITVLFVLSVTLAYSQDLAQSDFVSDKVVQTWRHSIGSSLFLLGNLDAENPPHFYQLNYGYQLTDKEILLVEATSWAYNEPLGTYGNSDELYPGKVKAFGVGLGYQRFFWNNMYASAVATPFLQKFYDEDNKQIQDGFQLYLQFITGYRLEFLNKRWFVEPAIALKYWPVNSNFPDSFDEIEDGKPNYKFEPGANFGFKF